MSMPSPIWGTPIPPLLPMSSTDSASFQEMTPIFSRARMNTGTKSLKPPKRQGRPHRPIRTRSAGSSGISGLNFYISKYRV